MSDPNEPPYPQYPNPQQPPNPGYPPPSQPRGPRLSERMGARAVRRPEPRLGVSLAGVGIGLAVIGVIVWGGDRWLPQASPRAHSACRCCSAS